MPFVNFGGRAMRIVYLASFPILLAAGDVVLAQGGGALSAPQPKLLPPTIAAPPGAQPGSVVAVPVDGDGQQTGPAVVVKQAPPPAVVVQQPTPQVLPPSPPPQRSPGYSYPRY